MQLRARAAICAAATVKACRVDISNHFAGLTYSVCRQMLRICNFRDLKIIRELAATAFGCKRRDTGCSMNSQL